MGGCPRVSDDSVAPALASEVVQWGGDVREPRNAITKKVACS